MYAKLSFGHVYPDRIRQFLQRTIGETELIADAGTSRADLAKAYYTLGLDHMANGRYAAARENLARVVDLRQNWLPNHYVARLLCERIGDQ